MKRWLLSIGGLAVLLGVSYFFFQSKRSAETLVGIGETPVPVTRPESLLPVADLDEQGPAPLVVSIPSEQWEMTCTNTEGGYKVKYPKEWSVKMSEEGEGMKEVTDCRTLHFTKDIPNILFFSPLTPEKAKKEASGIAISVEENTPPTEFRVYKETNILGEKARWANRGYVEFTHDHKLYSITFEEDVNEKLIEEFLSTFSFLQ